MTETRFRHLLALLGTLAIPALSAWQSGADRPAKIALVAGVIFAALLDANQMAKVTSIVKALAVVAAPVVAGLLGHVTSGSVEAYVVTLIPAVLLNLQKALGPAPGAVPTIEIAAPEGPGGNVATERPSKPGPLSLVVLLFGLLLPGRALADAPSPTFGGCFSPTFCAGPSASISLVSFNLATSEFSGGIAPGIGYGVTYTPTSAPWAAVGLDLYASLRLGQGLPNQGTFSLMGHFANYVFLGIGPSVTQQPAGQKALVQWSILGGMGVPLGLDAYRARSAGTK